MSDLEAARARAIAARQRLTGTLGEVQERLKPSTLAHDAIGSAAEGALSIARKGAASVRQRPLAVAAVAGAVGLVMSRNWISDILAGRKKPADATPKPQAGLKPRRRKSTKGQPS
ncbi:DUF3618 domain-containing protein [Sphingomonas sp. AOB5]|uniref:DUF3618 domain-containing protein n=1 Tax=Sphingomonas sp. AOB5 TaxID=3034017 RepID=UPI0023F8FB4B|nr:DUF3618 domain-containing protein [Sphingomonas sp. AOB5]MDF7774524.1 DUF3618 domain-containing protein [Sphingomonas sp. AOB5]